MTSDNDLDRTVTEARSGQLAALLNDTYDAIIVMELNGCITSWNRGAERMYGYSESQARSMNISDMMPEDRRNEVRDLFDRMVKGENARSLETSRLTHDNRKLDVWLTINPVHDNNGDTIGVFTIERDITASKQMREELRQLNEELEKRIDERTDELRQREERSRIILETAPDAIIIIDHNGLIQDYNQAAVDTFGYSAKEAIGRNVSLLMPSPYQQHHSDYIASYLNTGESRVFCRRRVVVGLRKDGSTFPMALTISEINHMELFVGIVRDISVRRRLQSDLAKARNNEQERIGRELHDGLGQRLTGLSMMAASLRHNLDDSASPHAEAARDISDQLKQAIDEARRIAHGLSPLQQIEGGLAEMLAMLAEDTRKATGIEVHFENLTGIPGLIEDQTAAIQLYRISQEAVHNAIKHAQAHKIDIKLMTNDKGEVELRVLDDGRGFNRDDTHTDGIGLRVMHYRADAIGCELTIESSPGNGTCIRSKLASLLLPDAGLDM